MNKIIILFFLFSILLTSNAQKESYSFIIAGHVYGTPGYASNGIYDPMVNKFSYILSRPEIELIFFTGDMVVGSTEQNWNFIDEDLSILDLPWYNAVGNHDCSNLPLFIERYHKPDTFFVLNNDLFIILNCYFDQWNVNQQHISMVSNAMLNNDYNNIFVFAHQVLWWSPNNIYKTIVPNSTDGRADSINFWTHFEPLFYNCGHNVFFFSGDVGATNASYNLYYDNYDNMHLIASGMGNKKDSENFLVANVNQNNVSFDIICLNGNDLNCLGNNIAVFDSYANPHSNNLTELGKINIYPNPVNDFLNIENLKDYCLSIYNINGKKVSYIEINDKKQQINMSTLEPGIYTLIFIIDKQTYFKKIIKL